MTGVSCPRPSRPGCQDGPRNLTHPRIGSGGVGGNACLAALLAAAIEPVRGVGTVGELLRLVIDGADTPPAWAEMALKRLGLRVMTDHAGGRVLALASHHAAITALLDGTAWAIAPGPIQTPLPGQRWVKALRQISGARLSHSRHRFPPLPEPARALFLPLPIVAAHLLKTSPTIGNL